VKVMAYQITVCHLPDVNLNITKVKVVSVDLYSAL